MSHSESGELKGKQAFKEQTHGVFVSAFPDLRITIEGMVAAGDDVVVRWVFTGTHRGDGRIPGDGSSRLVAGHDLDQFFPMAR